MTTYFPMLAWILLLALLAAGFIAFRRLSLQGSKRIERWFTALCVIPWLLIMGVYMEACVVRLWLSRWPRPMLDDPKQLSTAPLHLVFQILFLSIGVAIPLLIIISVWNWRKILNDWRYSMCIGVFALGLAAFWLLNQYDPGRIWEWFFD